MLTWNEPPSSSLTPHFQQNFTNFIEVGSSLPSAEGLHFQGRSREFGRRGPGKPGFWAIVTRITEEYSHHVHLRTPGEACTAEDSKNHC
ncbi:hypothetical protein VTO42DRAFT_1110 [Malbranchea cinnamomea]